MTYSTPPDPLDELAAALAWLAVHLDAAADAVRAEHQAFSEAAALDPPRAPTHSTPRG